MPDPSPQAAEINAWLKQQLPGHGRVAAETRAELAAHLEASMLDAMEAGTDPQSAFDQATRELGETRTLRRWLLRRQLIDLFCPRFLLVYSALSLLLATITIVLPYKLLGLEAETRWGALFVFTHLALMVRAIGSAFRPLRVLPFLALPFVSLAITFQVLGVGFLLRWCGLPIPWLMPHEMAYPKQELESFLWAMPLFFATAIFYQLISWASMRLLLMLMRTGMRLIRRLRNRPSPPSHGLSA